MLGPVCWRRLLILGCLLGCGRATRTPPEESPAAAGGMPDSERGAGAPAAAGAPAMGGAPSSAGTGAVAGSGEAPPVDVGGAGAPSDGGAGGAPAETDEYREFLLDRNDAWYARWSECFRTPRSRLPFGEIDSAFARDEESLRLGLRAMDPVAARRCLETLTTATCERIAEIAAHGAVYERNAALPECDGVLVGQVQPGSACRGTGDCQFQEQYACVGDWGCDRVCRPRTMRAAGEACVAETDRCPGGTVCRFGVEDGLVQHCLAPTREGGDCRGSVECAPDLHCARRDATAVLDGTCRAVGLGLRCAGNWECPYAYVCEGAGPNVAGTCRLGKPVGEPCTKYLEDVNGNVYSDCAPATQCFDLDGKGPRCVEGAPLGARCGAQTGAYSGWIVCIAGYCAADPMSSPPVGVCEPLRPAGEACEFDMQCSRPNSCVSGPDGKRCGLDDFHPPLGAHCSLVVADSNACGPEAYCAPPPEYDPLSPVVPEEGSCTPLKRAGEPCREYVDLCEPLAECIQGSCKRC